MSKLLEIWSGLFIPDPDLDFFYPSRIQGSKRHRIPDPDPQHWKISFKGVEFADSPVVTVRKWIKIFYNGPGLKTGGESKLWKKSWFGLENVFLKAENLQLRIFMLQPAGWARACGAVGQPGVDGVLPQRPRRRLLPGHGGHQAARQALWRHSYRRKGLPTTSKTVNWWAQAAVLQYCASYFVV